MDTAADGLWILADRQTALLITILIEREDFIN